MKIERKKVSMQVFDHIKEMMKTEKMKPGDKLPSESKLSEMFGVSRSPIREALSVLEASGLIKSRQGGGSVVQEASISKLMEETQLEFMDVREVLSLLETRQILESEAAALAAERHHPADKEAIHHALGQLHSAHESDKEIGHQEDIAFHLAVAKASHNPILVQTLEDMLRLYGEAIKFSLKKNIGIKEKRLQVLKEHSAVYEAVTAGDAEMAKVRMHSHLQVAKEKFASSIEKIEASE